MSAEFDPVVKPTFNIDPVTKPANLAADAANTDLLPPLRLDEVQGVFVICKLQT